MKNLIKKYGPLGAPTDLQQQTQQPRAPKRLAAAGRAPSSSLLSIDAFSSEFKNLISAATPTTTLQKKPRDSKFLNVVASKASNSHNGLETSTFTVCTRVRPLLGHELKTDSGCYAAAVPGRRTTSNDTGSSSASTIHAYTEELLLHTPKVSVTGVAKLDTSSHDFDYVFGEDSTNEEVYDLACAPLVKRALNGQVGVVFAYGQTGSGKTHTMSGILDILSTSAIFGGAATDDTDITFSYIEMLGREIKDCLPSRDAGVVKAVQIGEGLNGDVLIRNMESHNVGDAAELGALIKRANATRATAATAKNETSSRSHGVAILKVKNRKTTVEGTLYVIDLAGSESAKDSKDHDKNRMKETKEINSSLMVLKECIRARTTAAGVDGVHVPYRRNKLTLLMKDVFDIGCSRLCSTVVIANCSPLVSDIAHTKNTVKYAAPLRVAVATSNRQKNFERDVFDPALWNNDEIVSWVESVVSGKIDARSFVKGLTGVQFCALSENEFYKRAEAQAQRGDEDAVTRIAKTLYSEMWMLIVDAKTRKRRPDGSIVTREQEEEERNQIVEKTLEKAKLWAEREKHF